MTQNFYSNGKLLLSGEYAILDGAEGWAIPTKFGQSLTVTPTRYKVIEWRSLDADGTTWFTASLNSTTLTIITTSNKEIAQTLKTLLGEAKSINSNFLNKNNGIDVETTLTFPRNWGLGTSSTLINNIASWAMVDPYMLLAKTFGGSGYDLACAQHHSSIIYKLKNNLPYVQAIQPEIPFSDQLFFVYLNRKKNSRDAIKSYRTKTFDKAVLIESISTLTRKMILCSTLDNFKELINTHEQLLSSTLEVPTIKAQLFSDYNGVIKSLGGWGGDFIMATGNEDDKDYFASSGYTTILSYNAMAL